MTRVTTEELGFLKGLYSDFLEQKERYGHLVEQMQGLKAKVGLAERQLRYARDYLDAKIRQSKSGLAPPDWEEELKSVRFVGARLADACLTVLAESETGHMTTEEIEDAVNDGCYRFHTAYPAREISAALLKQTEVRRDGNAWIYQGPAKQPRLMTVNQ